MRGVDVVDPVHERLREDGATWITDKVDSGARIGCSERCQGWEGDDEIAYGAGPEDQDALN